MMGRIENNLIAGEHIIFLTGKHWVILLFPFVIASVPIAVGVLLLPLLMKHPLGLLLSPASLIVMLPRYAVFKTSHFAVTNKRVVMSVGVTRRETVETFLSKIEGIQVDQKTILARFLGYGNVVIKGIGGDKQSIDVINDPQKFRKVVQEQIDKNQAGSSLRAGNNVEDRQSGFFCEQCGTPMKPGTKFCRNCGKQA